MVEILDITPAKGLHQLRNAIIPFRSHEQMDMVCHENPCMNSHFEFFSMLLEPGSIGGNILDIDKTD